MSKEPLFTNERENQSLNREIETPPTRLNMFDMCEKPTKPLFRCSFCRKKFSQKVLHNIHLEQKHTMKRVKKPGKLLPEEVDPKLNCFSCSKAFESRRKLWIHKKEFHSFNPKIAPNPLDNCYCRSCNLSFFSTTSFFFHLRKKHNLMTYLFRKKNTPILNPDSKPKIDSRNWFCSPCGIYTISKIKHIKHLRRCHRVSNLEIARALHAEAKPDFNDPELRCTGCDIKFSYKHCFKKHLIRMNCYNGTLNDLAVRAKIKKIKKFPYPY